MRSGSIRSHIRPNNVHSSELGTLFNLRKTRYALRTSNALKTSRLDQNNQVYFQKLPLATRRGIELPTYFEE